MRGSADCGADRCALQMAKSVIVVEFDYNICREFLNSKAGGCAMQQNVHIYCPYPASSSNSDTEANKTQKYFKAAEDLIGDVRRGESPMFLAQHHCADGIPGSGVLLLSGSESCTGCTTMQYSVLPHVARSS